MAAYSYYIINVCSVSLLNIFTELNIKVILLYVGIFFLDAKIMSVGG